MKEILKDYLIPIIVGFIWLVAIILVAIPQTNLDENTLVTVNTVVGVIFGGSTGYSFAKRKDK